MLPIPAALTTAMASPAAPFVIAGIAIAALIARKSYVATAYRETATTNTAVFDVVSAAIHEALSAGKNRVDIEIDINSEDAVRDVFSGFKMEVVSKTSTHIKIRISFE